MSFEKMRVYQAAELLDGLVSRLVPSIKSGFAKDVDHLRRAAASVPYNIAEAFGSVHIGQKVHHLGIARGSVDETRSALRKLANAGAVAHAAIIRPSSIASTIAKMLTAWINNLEEQA